MVISGWYGMGNLGDEVILQSMVSALKSRLGEVSFTGLSEKPGRLKSDYRVNSIRNSTRRIDFARKVFAIARADAFILGGGGILMDYGKTDTNVSKWLADMDIAQRLGVHNLAWGVGVGKVWTAESKRWIADVLPRSDRVSVRDKESAAALSALDVSRGVAVTCDPALLLPSIESARDRRAKRGPTQSSPRVLVCMRHWHVAGDWTQDEAVFSRVEAALASLADYLSAIKGASLTFVPFRTEGKDDDDREVGEQVKALLKGGAPPILVDHVPRADEFLKLAVDADLVIGMRLHSLVLASAVGVPCLALSYDPKVRNFMTSIGADDWVLSMEDASFEALRRMADAALAGGYPSALIGERIAGAQRLGKDDIDRAVELIGLDGGLSRRAGRLIAAAGLTVRNIFSGRRRARKTPG